MTLDARCLPARETGGEEGLSQARLELQKSDLSGTEFDRTLAQSRLGRSRLLAPPASCAEWNAVSDDDPKAAEVLAGAQPVDVLRSGPRCVDILRGSAGIPACVKTNP